MSSTHQPVWQRILVKISGEALAGEQGFGIHADIIASIAEELAQIVERKVELAVVIGGGNFFRGMKAAAQGMDRVSSDYIGMLATAMNALALQQALDAQQVSSRVLSAIAINGVAEPYVRARALKHLALGRVVIFAAGTGNPLFTTDTAASLRALEINAEVMVKATRVNGVYSDDPEKNPQAIKFDRLGFQDILDKGLKVMDTTAITLCQENDMPIQVLNLLEKGNLIKMINGEPIGTLVLDRSIIS